jgi:hypothetical protein
MWFCTQYVGNGDEYHDTFLLFSIWRCTVEQQYPEIDKIIFILT